MTDCCQLHSWKMYQQYGLWVSYFFKEILFKAKNIDTYLGQWYNQQIQALGNTMGKQNNTIYAVLQIEEKKDSSDHMCPLIKCNQFCKVRIKDSYKTN